MTERTFLRLSPAQARDWLQARPDALILDAREERHHALGHLAGSVRLDGRNHEALLMRERRSRPVLIYCYRGHASQTWAAMFADFGFREVADLIDGWSALDPQGRLFGPQPPLQLLPQAGGTVPAALALWLAAEGFDHARPGQPAAHGNTPLMHAAWRGRADLAEALLDLGVAPDAVNHDGNNALWLACVNGDTALVRRLVARGVPLEQANLTGATALMYAASAGKAEVVATLLDLGANPLRRSQDDFSALDMAATVECLRLLRAATRRAA
ncbi:MAG: ankyrin repeat domain-containing protein [Sphaerotilus natans]